MYEKLTQTRFIRLFSGEKAQTAFKLAYLWLVLLSFNSFFAETAPLSYCSYTLALFGAPIVLARVIDFKSFRRMPLIGLMCLFLVSFLISAINTAEYGITQNIQGFAWMTFEFLILFAHSENESIGHACAELTVVAKSVCIYTLVCSSLGLVMKMTGYTESVTVADGVVNLFGVQGGRLWGVYSDPNIGAVLCVLAVMFAVWLYVRKELSAILLVINVVAQMGFIAASGSRGSLLCAVAASFVVVGLVCWRSFVASRSLNRIVKTMGCALFGCAVVVACVFSVGAILQKASDIIQSKADYVQPASLIGVLYPSVEEILEPEASVDSAMASDSVESDQSTEDSQVDAPPQPDTGSTNADVVDMGSRFVVQDDLSGFSAGRLSIWGSAIDVFESSPLVGISHRNILAYTQDVLPDSFIARASYTTMHNILFDVIVSQGIIGFILFVAMAVSGVKNVILFLRNTRENDIQGAMLAGVLVAVGVASMFYTEIIYINSPSSILFWIVLGSICHTNRSLT